MVGARQFDEQEVIAIALDVFWRKGLHDATMQDLATATGVQRGSLYNAYGDKEAIFLRAFDQYAGQFLETAGNALAQGDAAARLRNFFDVIIANMTSGSPPRGCLTTRPALLGDARRRAPPSMRIFQARQCAGAYNLCSAGLNSSSAKQSAPLPASCRR